MVRNQLPAQGVEQQPNRTRWIPLGKKKKRKGKKRKKKKKKEGKDESFAEGRGIKRKLPDKALIASIQVKSPCCGDEPLRVIYRVYCRILPFVSLSFSLLPWAFFVYWLKIRQLVSSRLIPASIVSICLPIALKMNGRSCALSFPSTWRLEFAPFFFHRVFVPGALSRSRVSKDQIVQAVCLCC